jgi:hypothetical protein
MNELISIARGLDAEAPVGLDLTSEDQLRAVYDATHRFLETGVNLAALSELEAELVEDRHPVPLLTHLAVKLARSKHLVDSIDQPTHLSMVFAMYKEHRRIRPRSRQNPVGEDFLRRKAHQLDWLFRDNPRTSWQLLAVDDGCPEGSGRIAQEIIDEMGAADRIRVLSLDDAIRQGEPVTQPLRETAESQKGGSILLGMWEAARSRRPGHVVAFTDADLSTHLGQCGLLLDPIVHGDARVAIGSRRESTSVVVKQGRRNTRGRLFIYLWKQLLPALQSIIDTQCGFKFFQAEFVEDLVHASLEKRFAFDLELLLRAELASPGCISKVAIAWIDSEAASTTTDLEPYLPMLRTTVALYRHYLDGHPRSEEFARLIESLDDEGWNRLIDAMPSTIAETDPADFHFDSPVQARELVERA